MSRANPRIPSIGDDPREQFGEVEDPPGKIWFRDLDEAVIEADRCIQCASCVAACPSDSLGIDEEEGRPTLVRMCTGCSSCWDYCPRSGLRYERVVELVDEAQDGQPDSYAARAIDGDAVASGQDGGVVTALLTGLLEAGEIDGALVAKGAIEQPLRGTATLATTREELFSSAGSIYTQTMGLGRLDDFIEETGLEEPQLALVGTPCVIQGANALERYDHASSDSITLTLSLMCTRTFEYDRLTGLLAEHGVDPTAVEKMDVVEGVLFAYDQAGSILLEAAVESFDSASLRGCAECADFVGGAADISAGSIGSEDGYTTVLVRTERGRHAWERGAGALETTNLERVDAVERLAAWNERRALEVLPRAYDPDGSVGISYGEHRRAYDGTDREPEPLNPARVHQYEEWC